MQRLSYWSFPQEHYVLNQNDACTIMTKLLYPPTSDILLFISNIVSQLEPHKINCKWLLI